MKTTIVIGSWEIPDTPDALVAFAKRLSSALEIKPQQIHLIDNAHAQVQGSASEPYNVTLDNCECSDFFFSASFGVPCKHIIRLAIETGNANGIPSFDRTAFSQYNFDEEIEHLKNLWECGVLPPGSFHKAVSVFRDVEKEARKLTPKPHSAAIKPKQDNQSAPAKSTQQSFAITGIPSTGDLLSLIEKIVDCGYVCSSSCSRKTSFLLVMNNPSTDKIERAESLGIPIVSEAEVLKHLTDGTPFI